MKRRLKIVGKAICSREGFFSVNQIAKDTSINPKDVRVALDRLFREGLLERFDLAPNPGENSPLRGRPKRRTIYQVVNKEKFKERFVPRLKQDTASDRMWRVIRIKGTFSIRDLVLLAGVNRENCRYFVRQLYRAGYISPSKQGGPGVVWSLIRAKDPGPQRPYLGDGRPSDAGRRGSRSIAMSDPARLSGSHR